MSEEGEVTSEPWELMGSSGSSPVPFSREPFPRWSPLLSRTPVRTNFPDPAPDLGGQAPGTVSIQGRPRSRSHQCPVPLFTQNAFIWLRLAPAEAIPWGPAGFWCGCSPYQQGQCFLPTTGVELCFLGAMGTLQGGSTQAVCFL